MKRWFQMFVDEKNSEDSVPFRIDPDHIYGYKKFGVSQTIVFTKIGAYTVCEDYEHFSSRLFAFVNEPFTCSGGNNEEKDPPPNKKLIVKRKVSKINRVEDVEESYFDKFQPDTNY